MMRTLPNHPKQQRGVVLAVVLILLLIMTLLGLASLRGTLMEERMGASQFDRSLAFQATEAALREGEAWVLANKPTPAFGSACSAGVCGKPDPSVASDQRRWVAAGFWADGSGTWKAATVDVGDLTATPRYIVELLDTNLPMDGECTTSIDMSPGAACTGSESRYRITAHSQMDGRAEVTLQSIYAVP